MFDRNNPIPLVYQVEQRICYWIVMGEYRIGEFLPSQGRLESKFGVSRITIRTALARLVTQGIVESYQGKGTKVIKLPSTTFYNTSTKKNVNISQNNFSETTECTIISAQYALPNIENTGACPIEEWESYHVIHGLRYLDSNVIAWEDTYLDGDKISSFSDSYFNNVKKMPKQYFHMINNIEVVYYSESFFSKIADKKIAETLGVKEGYALLGVKRLSYCDDKSLLPFECRHTILRHEDYGILQFDLIREYKVKIK